MVDLAAGVEAKNYGLNTGVGPKILWEYFKVVLPLLLIACVLSFHVWIRAESIRIGYECQRAGEQMRKLQNARQQLIVQRRTLQNPKSVDSMARNNLGMIILRANQVIPPDSDNSGAIEMGSLYRSDRPQAAPALN